MRSAKPSELSLVVLKARAACRAARHAYLSIRKPTDGDKLTYTAAIDALTAAIDAENRDRFVRFADLRAKNAINFIRLLRKCANAKSFKYGPSDVDFLMALLGSELITTENILRDAILGDAKRSLFSEMAMIPVVRDPQAYFGKKEKS